MNGATAPTVTIRQRPGEEHRLQEDNELMDLSLVELAMISGATSALGRLRTHRKLARWQRQRPQITPQVPTIFVHGLRGSSKTMAAMLQAAVQTGYHQMLTIHITHAGKLKIRGRWDDTVVHPLIQITFGNNQARLPFQVRWLHEVMIYLRGQHGVQAYNAVGHSAGSVALVAYAEAYSQDAWLPRLRKLVTIAGPFNGVIGMNESHNTNFLLADGRPKVVYPKNFWLPSYADLYQHRQDFPQDAAVLNIYGDLNDGTHSDRYISTASARSLRYLLRNIPASFREVGFLGASAEHSRLHDNPRVQQLVFDFLFKPAAAPLKNR
ncbi:cell surface hydrolase [Levilactobacillus spicheri DSM 15429]|uniref:Cell surface hydrolase n=2 Tax=Levilactobacillus spicheri TaxID=216463 RepID=A0A0R1R4B4_9LACO|nr:cell surface hydrolase [Levilactobacillus spicheri DSM 15429]